MHQRLEESLYLVFSLRIDQYLARRFSELRDYDFGWNDTQVFSERIAQLPAGPEHRADYDTWVRRCIPIILKTAGVKNPSDELMKVFETILTAESFTEIQVDGLPLPKRRHQVDRRSQTETGEALPLHLESLLEALWVMMKRKELTKHPTRQTHRKRVNARGWSERVPISRPKPVEKRPSSLLSRFLDVLRPARRRTRLTQLTAIPEPVWGESETNRLAPCEGIGPKKRAELVGLQAEPKLVFSPRKLPPPYRYAIHVLGDRFDSSSQSWSTFCGGGQVWGFETRSRGWKRSGFRVVFDGTILPGVSKLPIPFTGRTVKVELDSDRATVQEPGSTVRVEGDEAVTIHYEVELYQPPMLYAVPTTDGFNKGRPKESVKTTVKPDVLPRAVRLWLSEVQTYRALEFELALTAVQFVQNHYALDDNPPTRPRAKRHFGIEREGVGNHRLELLHAAQNDEILGRGSRYDLNLMLVELLRHLSIGAGIAFGWVLDEGLIGRPDHPFVVALIPHFANGCVPFPLDAAPPEKKMVEPAANDFRLELLKTPTIPEVGGVWSLVGETACPGEMDTRKQLDRIRSIRSNHFESAMDSVLHAIELLYRKGVTSNYRSLANLIDKLENSRSVDNLWRFAERCLEDGVRTLARDDTDPVDLLNILIASMRTPPVIPKDNESVSLLMQMGLLSADGSTPR